MRSWILDKDTYLVLSGWFANLSAGWFGAIFILPIFTDTRPILLLTINLPAAILTLFLAILFQKKGITL